MMNKALISLSLLTMFVPATFADEEFVAACEAYAEERPDSPDCNCLDEAAQVNPELYDEYAKVQAPEDEDLLSELAKEIVAACKKE